MSEPPQALPPYPPQGVQPPYPPYPAPFNTYAILSLVFAVAVFPPLGIYFGSKAKQQIAQTGERGIELATAGIICGWLFSVLQGAFLIIFCGLFVTSISAAASVG